MVPPWGQRHRDSHLDECLSEFVWIVIFVKMEALTHISDGCEKRCRNTIIQFRGFTADLYRYFVDSEVHKMWCSYGCTAVIVQVYWKKIESIKLAQLSFNQCNINIWYLGSLKQTPGSAQQKLESGDNKLHYQQNSPSAIMWNLLHEGIRHCGQSRPYYLL